MQTARAKISRDETFRQILKRETQLTDLPGAVWPVAIFSGQLGKILLIGKSWQGIIGLWLQINPLNTAFSLGFKNWQPRLLEKCMNQRRYEYSFAGTRQARNPKAHCWLG